MTDLDLPIVAYIRLLIVFYCELECDLGYYWHHECLPLLVFWVTFGSILVKWAMFGHVWLLFVVYGLLGMNWMLAIMARIQLRSCFSRFKMANG